MTRVRSLACAIVALAAPLFASASWAQLYIGGEAGWTGLVGETDKIAGVTSVTARFNAGFNAGLRAGYEWGPWRFEEEYTYRRNGARDLVGSNFTLSGVGGNRHTNSIMPNVLYDFTVGFPITPHFGFGIGAVNVFDGLKVPGIGQLFNDSTWQFGYQGIAGIRYNLSPTLTLDLDYRYLATTQPTFAIPNTNLRYKSYYNTNNFVASLIYRFASTPPPPPVPRAPPHSPRPGRRACCAARTAASGLPRLFRLGSRGHHAGGNGHYSAGGQCLQEWQLGSPAGDRVHRPVRLAGLQPGPFRAARQQRCQRAGRFGCGPRRHGGQRPRRERPARADPTGRARAAEPSCRDRLHVTRVAGVAE